MDSRRFRLRALAAKLRGFLHGRQRDTELDEEIREHVRALTERFMAQGLSRERAAEAARRQFGNTTLVQEDRRAMKTLPSIEAWWYDLRFALRTLWKSRAFAAVSIATLGLGIGATTAIFSVIDNVLLAPFPEKGADRMVFMRIQNSQQRQDQGRQGYTATEVLEIAETNHVFDGVTAATGEPVLYRHGDGTDWLSGARVIPGTFEFFGMPALHGRVIEPRDYEAGAPPVFVMRHKTWQERFNGDPSVLNRSFRLNGTVRTLVGIMPPRFAWYGADVWTPATLSRSASAGAADSPDWFVLGRLRPDVTIQQAEADLTVIAHRLAKLYPRNYPPRFTVHIGKRGETVVGRFAATLYTVLAAVGVLLLIACSNVANLMLARATTREKEFALRVALGAGRARLIRLLLLESLVLAMAGAALGTFIAWAGLKGLVALMPLNFIPAQSVIELDAPVLAFTLCVAVVTALTCGLAPALQSSRPDVSDPLRDSGKGTSGGFRGRWVRDLLVVAEIALSLTLLLGAGLLVRSFVALREVRLGLQAEQVFQTGLVLPADQCQTAEQATAFFRALLPRVKALPGVVDAAVSTTLPPYSGGESRLEIAGRTGDEQWRSLFHPVSDAYFRVLRIAFRQGRGFSEAEVEAGRRVAVVNETFARTFLPNENPIGRRVRLAGLETAAQPRHDTWYDIVGVVGDVQNGRNRGLQAPIDPEVWVPHTLAGFGARSLMVRTAADPGAIMNALRQQVWAVDSGVALIRPGTFEDRLAEVLYAGPKFGMAVMTVFGAVGLILVTVGVYSVLAYSTAQRTHEIGIRMALGAEASDALGLVVKAGLRLVVGGLAIGVPISLVAGRVIGAQLVGVTAHDPVTLGGTILLLTMTAALACWIPARRAARVDPIVALRDE